jgi:hypothetical protein
MSYIYLFPFLRITWILKSLGVGRINVGNPLGHANCTMGLLHWKSKFDSTLLPFEFVLEDDIDQGGMIRGDIS